MINDDPNPALLPTGLKDRFVRSQQIKEFISVH